MGPVRLALRAVHWGPVELVPAVHGAAQPLWRQRRGSPPVPIPLPSRQPPPSGSDQHRAHRPPPPTTDSPCGLRFIIHKPQGRSPLFRPLRGPRAMCRAPTWRLAGLSEPRGPPTIPGMASAMRTGPMPPHVQGPGTEKAERRGLQDREPVCSRQAGRGAGTGHPEHTERPHRTGGWV